MMNALRLTGSFELSLFEQRTYLEPSSIQSKLEQLEAQELITLSDGQLQTTELGQRFLNNTIATFMPD